MKERKWEKIHSLALLTIVVGSAVILVSMGRIWWCSCGEPYLSYFDVKSKHNSQHILDYYSFSHFLHGVIFFSALYLFRSKLSLPLRFLIAVALEGGWEILENSSLIIDRYRSVTSALGYSGDSIANSIADLGFCALGFYFTSKVNWKITVMVALLMELGCLILIRDNLTLNVLMLTFPIDALKQWQLR